MRVFICASTSSAFVKGDFSFVEAELSLLLLWVGGRSGADEALDGEGSTCTCLCTVDHAVAAVAKDRGELECTIVLSTFDDCSNRRRSGSARAVSGLYFEGRHRELFV